jgi:hypothetical protein
MHIFKGFEDQSDTYHDTRTHYLMEQEPSLTQDQADGDGCCCCWQGRGAEREKRWALQGHAKSRSGSRYSMSRTCGPRDMIS